MSCQTLNIPTEILTSVNTEVRLRMVPANSNSAPDYTVVIADPVAYNLAIDAAPQGSESVALTTPSPVLVPAGTELSDGTTTFIVREAAPRGSVALVVNPLTAALVAGLASFTPEANDTGDSLVHIQPTPAYLDAGEVLTINGQQVMLTAGQPRLSTLFPCVPLTAPLADGETTTTKALLLVVGAMNATPASAPKVVDAARYISGPGAESQVVGTNRTLNVQLDRMDEDKGGNTIMAILYEDEYFKRKCWAYVRRENGEVYEGLVVITQGDANGPTQDKLTQTANMQFQGCSFSFTPAEVNDDVALGVYA